ncbi:BZ3500_MvSof-1268-A1-R1_Chr5-3g08211 [Microbotryum saponariae]|uniref:BZ3500_MvSof-1268-A1-R1_Chr5-3g08211 protein n=1 Tax=Microbotryum saponariae TaxID=289078 RepID=A0A2X0KLA0_9BASI|nr:BZ3500_MvSof-1268-A1-R1_Chr5-3g08211 [Microbotryum saponariae]SDA07970.1 BZ3501_MvSof-1269-A2-R1_Chr5-1g07355 [Microbotryum saponariae]
MSLLSDLVHLRTIESWAARAQQHHLQHGSPEGALSGAPRGNTPGGTRLRKSDSYEYSSGRAIQTVMLVQMGVFSEGNKPRPP